MVETTNPSPDPEPPPKAPIPKDKPAPLNVPAKLYSFDVRVTAFFTTFYGFHVLAVAGDPRHNGIVQIALLAGTAIATFLAINQIPPGKEFAYLITRIALIAIFSAGAFDLMNGDILLYLTAAQIFVILGSSRGVVALVVAVVVAFIPRGTDALFEQLLHGQLQLSNLSWLYDWNGHGTTASIVALLGCGGYALEKVREHAKKTESTDQTSRKFFDESSNSSTKAKSEWTEVEQLLCDVEEHLIAYENSKSSTVITDTAGTTQSKNELERAEQLTLEAIELTKSTNAFP